MHPSWLCEWPGHAPAQIATRQSRQRSKKFQLRGLGPMSPVLTAPAFAQATTRGRCQRESSLEGQLMPCWRCNRGREAGEQFEHANYSPALSGLGCLKIGV